MSGTSTVRLTLHPLVDAAPYFRGLQMVQRRAEGCSVPYWLGTTFWVVPAVIE